MELNGPCGKCGAECCKNYSVCLTSRDIVRIYRKTGSLDCIEIISAEGSDPEINCAFSLVINGKRKDRLLCLKLDHENKCTFLGADGLCSIYDCRPMICRIYPFNQKINSGLEYKVNFRCPMKWRLRKETEEIMENIEKNREELEEYRKLCSEWNSSLTSEKTLKEFLEFILAKIE